jgi:shikimate dehydrogenase
VAHSLSPRMHNAAFAALGLGWAYVPLPVRPGDVERAVRGLSALGFAGANVTVPHKQAVLPYMDEVTPIAAALGAVNTIVVRPDGSLLGDNTDGAGFTDDLLEQGTSLELPACRCILLGAGGAAHAIAYALAEKGASIMIANRTRSRAEDLQRTMQRALPAARIDVVAFPGALVREADLIVNATSLGLHPDADPLPWDASAGFRPGQVVYDLVYTGRTPFLALAEACGALAIGGLGMLVHQGVRAFELWTGERAPVDVMRAAVAARPQ